MNHLAPRTDSAIVHGLPTGGLGLACPSGIHREHALKRLHAPSLDYVGRQEVVDRDRSEQ